MAEVSEKFLITLRIDNKPYPATIRREEEEVYREAERRINDKLNLYKERFPGKGSNDYLHMTLLDLSLRLVREERRNDTAPFVDAMSNLTAEILSTLGEKG